MNDRDYYVYILSNEHKNVIYIGVTNDLVRRVYEHKMHLDRNSFTARYHVTRLIYYEHCNEAESAIAREKQLKSWNRKRKEKLIETMNPQWEELYDRITG